VTGAATRAVLRIARRDAWRAKGRSLLVIALIGAPVVVLAGTDIAYRTWQLDPGEQVTRAIGAADAGIQWGGGGLVKQTPGAWLNGAIATQGSAAQDAQPTAPTTADLRAALPAGSRVIERIGSPNGIQFRTPAGLKNTQLVGLDYADPLAKGLLRQVSGRAPSTTHEVALTSSLAASTGLQVGDTMQVTQPAGTLIVVGIVADAGHRHAQQAYVLPTATTFLDPAGDGGIRTWLVSTPQPVSWHQVRQLNASGYMVLSREAFVHRPPKSEIPDFGQGGSGTANVVATATLVAGMALLEVVLLAGPAFAVSARRQRRDLALVAAVGGRRSDLRNVVLANGIVLGIAAAIISVTGALLGAAVAIPTLGKLVDSVPGGFDVRPLELGGLALVSVLTALAAAVFPARGAARTDVVAALAGRRGAVRTRKRIPVIGSLIAGAGIAVSLGAVSASTSASVILAGVALIELGLIMCTPALLGLIARLGGRLPPAARLALRDTGRNRSAAAPAVAAVMAAVIGAIGIVIGVASTNDQDRRNYQPALPHNDAFVALSAATAGHASAVAALLRSQLPGARVVTVDAPAGRCDGTGPTVGCQSLPIALDEQARTTRSRYTGGFLPQIVIDDGSAVDALFGTSVPEARQALAAGTAVTVDASAIHDATVTVVTGGTTRAGDTHRHTLPAIAVERGFAAAQVILPPSVAAELGVQVAPAGVLADSTAALSDSAQQASAGALAKIAPELNLYVERGYRNPNGSLAYALAGGVGLLAVAAAIIATALANVDGRPDLVTLGAVGASPRTRRVLSMARAAVIATVGTVIGVVAGLVPPVAWVHATHRTANVVRGGGSYYSGGPPSAALHLVVPWLPLATTLIGVPLVATLIAGLVTRSRLPSERHAE
jgi:putative ABC transport system permease protein